MSAELAALSVGVLAAVGAAGVAWWWWRRRVARSEASVFEQLQTNQHRLWHGVPVTVIFDYESYLQEPVRRKVNVHTVQESERGEKSLIGFCHDRREDRAFKLHSIRGDVLVAKSGRTMPGERLLDALIAGKLTE